MLNRNAHSRQRLEDDDIGWLTTVSAIGRPSTAPVWFVLLEDDSILVFSKDPSVRVRNIAANPRVTLALNSDPKGHDIVVINGSARIDRSVGSASAHEAFLSKYQPALDAYEWTPEWFADNYPAPIVISIDSVRGR
jgi:PPOX class probable F420-dependent enzyme